MPGASIGHGQDDRLKSTISSPNMRPLGRGGPEGGFRGGPDPGARSVAEDGVSGRAGVGTMPPLPTAGRGGAGRGGRGGEQGQTTPRPLTAQWMRSNTGQ